MLGVFWVVDIVIVALLLVLLLLSLSGGGRKLYLNRLFSLFALIVAIWIPANHISNMPELSSGLVMLTNYIVFPCALGGLTVIMLLVLELATHERIKRIVYRRLLPFISLISALSPTPLMVSGLEQVGRVNAIKFGPLLPLYGFTLLVVVLVLIYLLYYGVRNSKEDKRRQLKVIGAALAVCVPIMMAFLIALPSITGIFEFTEFGVSPLFILVIGLYYSVVKYQLFDIKLAAVRTVGYVLSIAVMSGVYILLAYGTSLVLFQGRASEGVGLSPINVILALILAFIFQPIKRFFDQLTNKLFYRGEYDRAMFFREFGQILSYDTDLRLLLRQASTYLLRNLGAERVFFVISGRGVLGASGARKNRMPESDIEQIEGYYRGSHEFPEVIVTTFVQDEGIKRVLMSHQVSIALPLILQNQAVGYLFIGEHKGNGYKVRDFQALESIANELAIAVQNSLSVEEIRELNENLQRRVDEATKELRTSNRQLQRLDEAKNEFISMASHQLRTPLTSIKGYLDMVLEGDLGKVSATQRAVLSEAFISSERMVSLINDFLNVSRLQTGKFTIDRRESNVVESLKKELQMLSVIASQRDLKFKEWIDKSLPIMDVDDDKLRQVAVNMIDNAIYYSKPGTVIRIRLEKEGNDVVFTVKDTGIGVPKSEQSGLFGKFFRATNARKKRPDGTGVGLFLAKKVVTLHGGQIIFESEEGKGSTFGFRIPIVLPSAEKLRD